VTVQFDGSWSRLFDPKPMVKSVLHHSVTSLRKKTGTVFLASKVMVTVFWILGDAYW
jgi:hypothetical protein